MLANSNARLAAARRLTSPKGRRDAGRFLAEGPPAVREALARTGTVIEVFATAEAGRRHRELLADVDYDEISETAAGRLSETVSPQGVIAVCAIPPGSTSDILGSAPRLVVVGVQTSDPGNAGTIVRIADAAGADGVAFTRDSVDAFNGKAVRAGAGSHFHLDVATDADIAETVGEAQARGLRVLAASGAGTVVLDDMADSGRLGDPTVWLFGNEAHGLPADVLAAADDVVRIPIYGRAESLNLASAAAVCLYASARAQRAC